ncbi:MAG: glycerate kinase [Christensenellales bacterium]
MKKIIIAPDSFKGSLSSQEVIDIISEKAKRFFPQARIVGIPVADGGEGTVSALCGGETVTVAVFGPLGEKVDARYGFLGETAVMEMAAASGLPLVPEGKRDPRNTSSFGTGQMILDAVEKGVRSIVIGIGGSATNDGGMGALRAFGVRFLDEHGSELTGMGADLAKVQSIDASGLDARLKECDIRVMCDVTNPLTGTNGATYIYGPQKGGEGRVLDELEKGMKNYEKVMAKAFGVDTKTPGAGAAGGLGTALLAVGGKLVRGIDAVLDLKNFDAELAGCDLVVTGEGRFDSQSLGFGKVISGIIARAEKRNVPVAVVAGSVLGDVDGLFAHNASVIACVDRPMLLEEAMENAAQNLENAAARMFGFLSMGRR